MMCLSDPTAMRRQRGVTLIELMIAMVLGVIVSAGIITVFINTSKSNRAQLQLARMQEEGRFAMGRVKDDLRMANAQYCASTGGIATQNADDKNLFMDQLVAPTVYAKQLPLHDSTTPFGSPYPAAPTSAYALPSFTFMRGYDCPKTGSCKPADPPAALPKQGTDVGDRVVGSSVLTVRYFDASRGWAIGSNDSFASSGPALKSVTLTPETGEPPLTDIAAGDLLMIADCSNSQVFAVAASGSAGEYDVMDDSSADGNFSPPKAVSNDILTAPRIFDFNRDFVTVTYYLKVVSDDGTNTGHKTGALMRRVNGGDPAADGGSEDELIRGVERLDFRYAVEDKLGKTRYLTAEKVDNADSGGIDCPRQPDNAPTPDTGCLWRAIKAIEVSMLVDGQRPLPTLTDNDLVYAYSPDGLFTPKAPDDALHTIKPSDQGFERGMLRREFNSVIAVRNYNP